jgi:predicted dehydrogenase
MGSGKIQVGIVGCGKISGIYLQNGSRFENYEITAVSDIDMERAEAAAKEYGIVKACTVDEILSDQDIDIILNLTIPKAHFDIAKAALEAGKSVYNEKPLTETSRQARELREIADKNGVLLGGAPDTFMGAGIQTARKLIDEGAIGRPIAATAFLMCHGHESWHPDPEFYYEPGGGPMFDMGPYYLTALVNLLGPVNRVSSSARISIPERTITSEKKNGKVIKVQTPTHLAGTLDFANGAIGTVITSFDVWAARLPKIEIYGTEGSISVPDPNTFGGTVEIYKAGEDWKEVDLTHPYFENWRGLGVADMAAALQSGRAHRPDDKLTAHVLDVMQAFLVASDSGQAVDTSGLLNERPAPMPMELKEGTID